ncbi:MAG TPA: hypothetical protein VLJ80_08330 [Solirubrobacteraceae bacterium]|nr:hypothetical protein [Solirubrobacteraceae bacterium]
MAYWWDDDVNERYWVEIRKEPGIGTSLECPDHQINEGGTPGPNPWYELVRSVRKREIVYHYNEREQRFVGRSRAASDAQHVEAGYIVALEDFTPIAAPVDLAYLRARSATLFQLRENLKAAHSEDTIYTPFQFRGASLYGMMSNYFAKLPRDVALELFGVDGLAEEALPETEDGAPAPITGDDIDPGPTQSSFLRPFRSKADSDYLSNVVGGRHPRSRRHERLINDCAAWLRSEGMEPMRNAAIDLGLEDPPVIIEGKTVATGWAAPVRQAVSQLYEYRYFKVAAPNSALVFLAEKAVPETWVRYLEKDRKIGVMWPSSGDYRLSRLARAALRLPI